MTYDDPEASLVGTVTNSFRTINPVLVNPHSAITVINKDLKVTYTTWRLKIFISFSTAGGALEKNIGLMFTNSNVNLSGTGKAAVPGIAFYGDGVRDGTLKTTFTLTGANTDWNHLDEFKFERNNTNIVNVFDNNVKVGEIDLTTWSNCFFGIYREQNSNFSTTTLNIVY